MSRLIKNSSFDSPMPVSGFQPATTRTSAPPSVEDVREDVPRPEDRDPVAEVVLAVEPFQDRHVLVGNLVVAVDLGVGQSGEDLVVAGV